MELSVAKINLKSIKKTRINKAIKKKVLNKLSKTKKNKRS